MNTLNRTLAALMLAGSCAALAAPALADSTVMTADHAARASKLIGTSVYNAQNEKIGTLDDILVPAAGGAPSAVVSVGGYVGGGDKSVLVPLSHVRFHDGEMVMSVTKAQLVSMKSYVFRMAADTAG